MTPLLLALIFGRLPKAPMPFFVKPVAKGVADGAMKSFIQPQINNRLDYIEGKVVAALIYRRNKHVINLFVWPSDGHPPRSLSQDGYTLLGWRQAGLAYWAVSDLNAVELREFMEDFADRAPR